MKIITVNISEKQFKAIIKIVDWGLYPSRSECFRKLIDLGLPVLEQEIAFIEEMVRTENIINIKQFMEERGFAVYNSPEYKAKYDDNCKSKLGNPFWELSVDKEERIIYRNKEDPDFIQIPTHNGRLD